MNPSSSKSSPLLVLAAWVIVAIPLSWGLYQSVIKSKPLFTQASPPSVSPTAPAK
ncbi:MAG TPA: hypothetical protein VHD32_00750 [Candidatus Didemnitutus sp.]|nr:hypothetical protein [Candidatus Didemnitutus sp.]